MYVLTLMYLDSKIVLITVFFCNYRILYNYRYGYNNYGKS